MDRNGVFGWLHGDWRLVREVAGQATMSGLARVSAVGDGVAFYEERVEVRLVGGGILEGEQRYRYLAREDGLEVRFFDTGALFHALRFVTGGAGELVAEARHECGDDVYLSTYRIGSGDAFEVRHSVVGPRKDYTIETRYRRA